MSKNDNGIPSMYDRIPAVAALNKAPGFDPVKLLRRTVSQKTKEPVMKLDLPYKKLWFRLLYPNGRIKLKALRITEQMAIFEAQIFLDRTDSEPISSFTASCARGDSPNGRYVEDAQEAAADEALSTAGFGLQFADISMTSQDRRFGSEIPVEEVHIPENAPVQMAATAPRPAQRAQAAPNTANKEAAMRRAPQMPVRNSSGIQRTAAKKTAAVLGVQPEIPPALAKQDAVKDARTAPVQVQESTVPKGAVTAPVQNTTPSVQQDTHAQKALDILKAAPRAQVVQPETAVQQTPIETVSKEAAPVSYNASTPVEEIMKVMTLEEARNTKIENSIFAGKTLGELADSNKIPNIRFYALGGYKGKNNVFLAAAKIVYQALEQKVA